MTDSMKFGPEWLRNMSADITSISSNVGQNTTSATMSSCVMTTTSSTNSTTSPNTGSSLSNINNNTNQSQINLLTNTPIPRNLFPEFRYGREEMLSLFEKTCSMPEILPSYKNLYVEKVQYPLALTPSSEEEMVAQGPSLPSQRPAWLQRSPVSFSTSARSAARGCLAERGRIRGKSVYHPIFQRPAVMFDEDLRTAALKLERNWSERNGGSADSANTSGVGIINLTSEWNGTPNSSPRREFSSHSRNTENWRRSRNEDIVAEVSINTTAGDGWRINNSSAHRWGRSTSWRDDDLSLVNNNGSAGNGSSGGNSCILVQRSFSTISTSAADRGHVYNNSNNAPKPLHSSSYSVCGHSVSTGRSLSSGVTQVTRSGNEWSESNTGIVGRMGEDQNLPEWATENPSDVGGTFDSTGAFHGSIDEPVIAEESNHNMDKHAVDDDIGSCKEVEVGKISDECDNLHSQNSQSDMENCRDSTDASISLINEFSELTDQGVSMKQPDTLPEEQTVSSTMSDDFDVFVENSNVDVRSSTTTGKSKNETESTDGSNTYLESEIIILTPASGFTARNSGDYSDRMMKAADDMIEKLIMDDDDTKNQLNGNISKTPSSDSTIPKNINVQNTYAPSIQDSGAPLISPVSLTPKTSPLCKIGMVGGPVHHQHHQRQQMSDADLSLQLPPHPLASNAASELWFYRDPQSKVQGPFSALEMTEWYRAGYFNENLFVRRVCDMRFRPLGELIKICNGQMPFTNSYLIPIDLNPISTSLPAPLTQANFKIFGDHQTEEIKTNVSLPAESTTSALKSLINTVDMSQILNVHFQTLQERFIRNHEIEVTNELSKNKCFQRLTPSEREAFIRQKVQILMPSEYSPNFCSTGALNPTDDTHFYDPLDKRSKKEHLFTGQSQQTPQNTSNFVDSDDFMIPAQQTTSNTQFSNSSFNDTSKLQCATDDDLGNNGLLNELNLRMFLRGGSSGNAHDYLTEQQIFGTEPQAVTATQSNMMQMWMSQLPSNVNNHPDSRQVINSLQTNTQLNNHWNGGSLIGMPNIIMARTQTGPIMHLTKPTTSMWDVNLLEQHVQLQQQQKLHYQQQQHKLSEKEELNQFEKAEKQISEQVAKNVEQNEQQPLITTLDSRNSNPFEQHLNTQKEPIGQRTQQVDIICEINANTNDEQRHSLQNLADAVPLQAVDIYKRNSNGHTGNNNNSKAQSVKPKEDIVNLALSNNNAKKNEEDRRRDQNEEKRRIKEERKRQQVDEERRRQQLAEEEKKRHTLGEKERQQQIQSQRRKTILAPNASCSNGSATINISNCNQILNNQKTVKEHLQPQQRIHAPVAPWCIQTSLTKTGPGLAEIQKAERRERRADQQRQIELQERRALATDAQDAVLKWNAAPFPVKSFVEIQAEEVKRLANEQTELQRRKEEQVIVPATNLSGVNSITANLHAATNITNIWDGVKIWGGTSTGFWDDAVKFKTGAATNNMITAASVVAQSSQRQQPSKNSPNLQHQQQQTATKSIKKSQTIPDLDDVAISTFINNSQKKGTKNQQQNTSKVFKYNRTQKSEEKKVITKNNTSNSNVNRCDGYETEFFNWCTKSLSNMNAKVDVPTFASFLRDLESPYEVKDYIRMYLGENKEYTDFAKQFLERRSRYKSLQRAQNAHNDDLCKPAQAITPSINDNSDNKGKQKKLKKNKMTKLDARILGFSVTAAEGRINVGDRDYVDAP
uniref:GYF domain-containing protein n=1 Tax=Glossina morsitans morsitans TaxID=37546 RepID=A0A1B0GEJ7_GLOMM